MQFISITASVAVLLSCTAAVMAQRCNPVTELNGDDSITITGLGSTPDYTIPIEQDGTPISPEFLREFCSVVTTACSEATGDELEDEIAFCITDSQEFIDYTMAQLEEMVDYAQEIAEEEEMEMEMEDRFEQQEFELEEEDDDDDYEDLELDQGPSGMIDEDEVEDIDLDVDAEELDLDIDDEASSRIDPEILEAISA